MTLADDFQRRYEAAVRAAAPLLARSLTGTAPTRTGALRRAITVRPSGLRAAVDVNVPYATFLTEGTRPHPIVARRASVLRFFWGRIGKVVYFRRVNHPGTKPNLWYRDALDTWPTILSRVLR